MSTKFDKRLDQLEAKINSKKGVPVHERRFIVWDEHDGKAEGAVAAREQELVREYGTTEGFSPIVLGWQCA